VVELLPSFEPRAAMTMSTITRIAAMAITVHAVGLSETFVVVVDVLVLVLVVGAVVGTIWFCCVVVDELDESGGAVYVSVATM
jgi:fatty acid desaturase